MTSFKFTADGKNTPRLVDAFDHRVSFDDMMKWQKKKALEMLSQYGDPGAPEERRDVSKAQFTELLQKFNEANPDFKDPYADLPPRMKAGKRKKLRLAYEQMKKAQNDRATNKTP